MSYVLCCVDEVDFSQAVCDYGTLISNNINVSLKLLNVVEHNHNEKELDLSGSITLGEKENILQKLVKEEQKKSKNTIEKGEKLLKKLKQRASLHCNNEVITSQIHGEIIDNILELEDNIEILIIGIKSNKNHEIGYNTKEIIKTIHKPILLVNSDYIEPKKLLISYNGSNKSKNLLEQISSNLFFKGVKTHLVNKVQSQKTLFEVESLCLSKEYKISTFTLKTNSEDILIEYFNKNDYDILIIKVLEPSWLKGLFFESFTSKVLLKMKKPVLIFRETA